MGRGSDDHRSRDDRETFDSRRVHSWGTADVRLRNTVLFPTSTGKAGGKVLLRIERQAHWHPRAEVRYVCRALDNVRRRPPSRVRDRREL